MFYAYSIQAVCLSILLAHIFFCMAEEAPKFYSERTKMKQTELAYPKHPQEPVPPFPYDVQDVTYRNENANVTLAGTLTKPRGDGPFPVVILIAGMGATNRDGMMYGHKLYFVIADYLTRQGIAVLRFDKRGVGRSTGSFGMDVTSRELADDVQAGIDYLKTRNDIDHSKIGLIGHSEGGLIASLLATESKDVSFIVLMAGAIATSPEILAKQIAVQLQLDGASQELVSVMRNATEHLLTIVKNEHTVETAEQMLNEFVTDFLRDLPEALQAEATKYAFAINHANAPMRLKMYNSLWYRWLLAQDGSQILSDVTVPFLAMYGERDFMAPAIMLSIVEQSMQNAGNCDYTVLTMPGLNHAFQTCVTGALAEYATITETVAPIVLETTGDWILKRTC